MTDKINSLTEYDNISSISSNINKESMEGISSLGNAQPKSKGFPVPALIFSIASIIFLVGFFVYKEAYYQIPVKSYEECLASKGSTVKEELPNVCVTKDGIIFTQEINETDKEIVNPPNQELIERACYEDIVNLNCPEGTVCMPNPASYYCECVGGISQIAVNSDGSQYGLCSIGGKDYDEWEYFRLKNPQFVEEETEEETNIGLDYTFEKSEGICSVDSDCEWSSQGCGGGHGICTNEPEKYEDIVTTCEIDPNFPANIGYTCGCVETENKCGWKK